MERSGGFAVEQRCKDYGLSERERASQVKLLTEVVWTRDREALQSRF